MSEWNLDKKKAFTSAMGKREKRQKFSKGGLIKKLGGKLYFAEGGLAPAMTNAVGLGNNFQAQTSNITSGTNTGQLNQLYDQAQSGIGQQQKFYDQLQAQNGIGNQSNVYNQQQALANQLQQGANGQGPNAALMQLNQTTGQNVANQAALMAGQRGAGANVGLMAKNAAMQGAQTQQQAAGQAATEQAHQQMAYTQALQAQQGMLGNTAQNQVNQQGQALTGLNTATQNEQNILQNANSAFNNASVSNQANLNNVNAQISQGNQQMAGSVLGGIAGGMGGVSSIMGMFAEGGEVSGEEDDSADEIKGTNGGEEVASNLGDSKYSAPVSPGSANIGSMASTDVSKGLDSATKSSGGGGGGGGMMALMALDQGGAVGANLGSSNYASPSSPGGASIGSMAATDVSKGLSSISGSKSKEDDPDDEEEEEETPEREQPTSGAAKVAIPKAQGGLISDSHFHEHFKNYFHGGESSKVPAMLSPGEIYLSPDKVHQVIHEGADPRKVGEKIHGKAKVKGDSLKNDIIPKTLDEGGVVIPRHIAAHKTMSREKAELFVHRAIARKKAGR